MVEPVKQDESLSPEIQDVMRSLVTAIRAVKLYPANNPVYSQSVKKAFDSLTQFLLTAPHFLMGVQKTQFTYQQTPVAKDTQMNKAIAQDLFAKGVREMLFRAGIPEQELLDLFEAIALPQEELALRGGIVSILWEKAAKHIQVTEATLEDVIVADVDDASVRRVMPERTGAALDPELARKELALGGRTLVLGEIANDPRSFGKAMLELAKSTRGENETVEDRLHALYKEAGRQIQEEHPEQSDALFDGLAQSILEMEPQYRDHLINGKLYGELDGEQARTADDSLHEFAPSDLHEIMTGRFTKDWTSQQVAVLLKRSSQKPTVSYPPVDPLALEPEPITPDTEQLARELVEYTSEEMEALRVIGEAGVESDLVHASVRTLLFLLPFVKNPGRDAAAEKEMTLFSGVVRQLEGITTHLVKMKDFQLAMIILRAFRSVPLPPEFRPRVQEALRKVSSREIIDSLVAALRMNPKSSPKYEEAYGLLTQFSEEATPILLESLASEQDRSARLFYLDLLKELGREQIGLIAQGLSDHRWYVVRNIVSILAESRSEQAVPFLEKAADHKNQQVRQEVIKGLITIGGRRAAAFLTRYLKDKDQDIQFTALRALAMVQGAGAAEERELLDFLEQRRFTKKEPENDITREAMRTLGKLGGPDTVLFLRRYEKIRWWRSRKVQAALRAVAREAAAEIGTRKGDAGRSK